MHSIAGEFGMPVEITHLTPTEVAQALRLKGKNTLANWRAAKPPKGPRWIKHGRAVLYPVEEVERYKREEFKDPNA